MVVGGVAATLVLSPVSSLGHFSTRLEGHLRRLGKPMPTLEPASVCLYGKDGAAGQ